MGAILCFGDSITFGESHDGGWCGQLKRWFEPLHDNNGVYNLGVWGETSAGLVKRLGPETEARLRFRDPWDSYTSLIAVGVNDSKYRGSASAGRALVSERQFRANVLRLIRMSRSFRQRVAFLGLSPVDDARMKVRRGALANERVTLFNNIVGECCERSGVPFLDLNRLMLQTDYRRMLEDGLHPNAAGYRFMFLRIRDFLKGNGLLPAGGG